MTTLEQAAAEHLDDVYGYLAYLTADTWMTMIFRHGFFHGDPHPANILVLGSADQIGLVDFGLVGKLTDDDMSKLTRLFIDAANEQVDQLPRRLADLGVRYPKEREEEFLVELRELYYRYYGATLAEIDPLQVIREAFALIYSLNLQLPTRFVLLDKTIATLGSVGVDLYPDFNVFEVAKPYARRLLFMQQMSGAFNRLVVALVVASGLIGSSLIGIFAKSGPHVVGIHVISFIGFVLSGALALWLLLGVVRSGRL